MCTNKLKRGGILFLYFFQNQKVHYIVQLAALKNFQINIQPSREVPREWTHW